MKLRKGMEVFLKSDIYGITAEKFSYEKDNIPTVRAMLDADIKFIHYREQDKDAISRYEECLVLQDMVKQAGGVFIINDFVDLAMAVNADGVHIGQNDLPPRVVRKLLGEDKIIGLSVHNAEEVELAESLGTCIDYLAVGPIFPSEIQKDEEPLGLEFLRYISKRVKIPFVATGGINEKNLAAVIEAGAKTVAIVEPLLSSNNIENRTIFLRKQFKVDYSIYL